MKDEFVKGKLRRGRLRHESLHYELEICVKDPTQIVGSPRDKQVTFSASLSLGCAFFVVTFLP